MYSYLIVRIEKNNNTMVTVSEIQTMRTHSVRPPKRKHRFKAIVGTEGTFKNLNTFFFK